MNHANQRPLIAVWSQLSMLTWTHHALTNVIDSDIECLHTCNMRSFKYTDHDWWIGITRQYSYRKEDRAMRPIYGCPQKFSESSLRTHPATFPEICNWLLFRSILGMCVQKLKFVALPVPEIIGGTQKIWAVPVYAHAPFSPKILRGFCSHRPSEYICQIWGSYSFTRSWYNRGYSKNFGRPWIRPRSLYS